MASHLTVTTTSAAGITSSKSLSGQPTGAAEAEGGVLGAFAALLGAAGNTTGQSGQAGGDQVIDLGSGGLANLAGLALEAGLEGGEDNGAEDPELIANAIDAALPIQNVPADEPELAAILDDLATLKAALDAGEPLDPELLERLDDALPGLMQRLGIDLDALPTPADLDALLAGIDPDDASLNAEFTRALAPLAQSLLAGEAATADAAGDLKSIGDKLAALLTALNGDQVDPTALEADMELDADIKAALARLAAQPATVQPPTETPVLAAPELKLTEPVLTGKPADASADPEANLPEPTVATAAPTGDQKQAETGDDSKPDNGKPSEGKAEPPRSPVAAAAIDKQPEPQNSGLPPQASARAEMVAAPRVIQAGYQTSQQQLNLPQLAFELVRQVNDGNSRFQIRLDPPELGKIDVRLDIDASGQVNARLTVEKAETLDLMQRDQRALERALQQAGLDSSKTNLEFSLKQSPFGGQQGQAGQQGHQGFVGSDLAAETDETPPPTVNLYRGSLSASGVNIIA